MTSPSPSPRSNPNALLHALLLVLLLIAPACGTEDDDTPVSFASESISLGGQAGAPAFVPTLDGPLRPISTSPSGPMGDLPANQVVAVTFSRPMVPLGSAAAPPPGTLSLEPQVDGMLRWEGTQTLVFTPSTPLQVATRYQARLTAGLVSVDGNRLEAPFAWTFETPRLQVLHTDPSPGEPFADPASVPHVFFTQSVDSATAVPFLRLLEGAPPGQPVPITVTAAGDSALALVPTRPLKPATVYTIEVSAGLPGVLGSLGLDTPGLFLFNTYGPLSLVAVEQPRRWWEDERPTFDPQRSVVFHFSTPVPFRTLRQAVTFDPPLSLPPGLEARDDQVSTEHALPLPLDPETAYTVSVTNLADLFGQVLPLATTTFRTGALLPSLRMPDGLLVIEADQQVAVPLHATNLARVDLGMAVLRPEQIIPLLEAYDHQHWYQPFEEDHEPPAPVAATRSFAPGLPTNRPGTIPLRLDSLLTDSTGVIGLHVHAPKQPGWAEAYASQALAIVTRLGVTAKFTPHQNLVFVTDLATAQPVQGARVTLRDQENRVRWTGETDASGQAHTPGWSAAGIPQRQPWEHPPQYVFVERGSDFTFTSSLYNDGLEPYRFNLDYAWWTEPRTHTGSVFTDRGLYRTGETVNVKGILRHRTDADWQAVTDSIRVFMISPRNEQVFDRRFLPSSLGTFDFTWQAPSDAAQGVYRVRIALASDTAAVGRDPYERGDIAEGTFRVDAFRTSTFAVEATTAAPAYTAGDFFEGTVTGRYLFGAAMGGQPVTYALTRMPGTYAPPGFEGYRFGTLGWDSDSDGGLYRTFLQADTTLNAEGQAPLRVLLAGNEDGTPTQLVLQATVTDPARQELSARRTVTLHPGLFYIGLKPKTTFLDLTREMEMVVDVATVDPAGAPVGGHDVTVALVRRQWNSVREVGVDGRLRWRSERVDEPAGSMVVTPEAGHVQRLRLRVKAGGSYVIRATGRDLRGNTIRSEAYFYATGAGYVAWERGDDDRIELIPERTTFRPGETARIMVQSPYESATALLTVEREGILSSRVLHLTGSAPQIEIPLTEAHLPNVFVSLMLFQGRTAPPTNLEDVGAPSFKIGYTRLAVDPGVRHLFVDVKPDRETYRPGEEVTVDFQLRSPSGNPERGEIVFSAADAGVLNLIGYTLPDPFDTFYGPRELRVLTAESRANLVRQRSYGQKEEGEGGGGGDADYLLRQDFRPLAHWAPALRTDERGRARVVFRLPESLTTFRLMATALTANHHFGTAHTDIVVTQPLVLQPALPRFARMNDTFEAGVLVSNRTNASGVATVTAKGEGLALTGAATQTIPLGQGETREVRFQWQAPAPAEASLTFEATLGAERDALQVILPIKLPSTKETSATFAVTEGTVQEALQLPADRIPGVGGLEARLSSTALVGLDGASRYLFEYPYGCLEQRTSRIRPLLLADDLLDAFELEALDGDRSDVVQAWLRDLEGFWAGDGFSLWPGGRWQSPYVSAYVVLALAEAEAAGFQIPQVLAAKAVDALARHVRNRSNRPSYYSASVWDDTRALMLYALARHGRMFETEINALGEHLLADTNAGADGLGYVLRSVRLAARPSLNPLGVRLAQRLQERVRVEAGIAYLTVPEGPGFAWIFASNTRATAHGLTALLETGASDAFRPLAQRMVRYLMDSRRQGHWASTQENAAVIDAFGAFYRTYEATAPDFTAVLRVAGRTIINQAFEGRTLDVADAVVDEDALPAGAQVPVELERNGQGSLYYSLRLQTYSAAPQAAVTRGLGVERRVQRIDGSGQPVGESMAPGAAPITLEAGALVRITLRVNAPADRNYVVVDDALPAGLEALNAAFETTRSEAQDTGADRWWGSFNHTEMRDDRVLLFADFMTRGEHTYTYVARATTPGTFVYPPVQAEMMYRPETSGRTATGTLIVQLPASPTALR